MKKQDDRKLDRKGLTQFLQRSIKAVQNVEGSKIVARVLGVSRTAIINWLAKCRQGGMEQLEIRKRGSGPSKHDEAAFLPFIYDTLNIKNLIQFQFPLPYGHRPWFHN